MKLLFVILSLIYALPALAVDMSLKFRVDSSWQLKPERRESFSLFLDSELAQMQTRAPSLYWPEMRAGIDFTEVMFSTFYPASEKYLNRDFQCGFVHKLLSVVQGEAFRKLSELTDSGRICIQRDLPKEQWPTFTKAWMEFFWFEPWIERNGVYIGLEDLIRERMGSAYRRPKLSLALNETFDGFGWGISAKERELFSSVPLLAEFARRGRTYDPNSQTPFLALGELVEKMLARNPYGSAGLVKLDGEIIISPTWAPADLPDLLVHEYGHVFAGEQGFDMEWNEERRELFRASNQVQEEGVAESFAWILLQDAYRQFPEIKFFHLGKLRLFQEARPQDPHLLGAAALADLYHMASRGDLADLRDFARSHDIAQFFSARGLESIDREKVPLESELPITFTQLSE